MNKPTYKKVLDHPDLQEIIAKLTMGISAKDINEWLKDKYTSINQPNFILSEKIIKSFQSTYLDFYNDINQDLSKTKTAIVSSTEDQLELAVKGNSAYRSAMVKMAKGELDIRQIIATLAFNIEARIVQIFDEIQEDPRNINTRVDRLLIEYADTLGGLLDKFHKFTEVPVNQVVQHNVTLQVIDQHISVFHDVIKKVLSQMDVETSLYFMEVFTQEMDKLKMIEKDRLPSTEMKLAETKLLNETINQKLNND